MSKWYDNHKFQKLIDNTSFINPKGLKIEHYMTALDQVYESREAFMKSADSVAKFIVLQYTVILGFIYVLCFDKDQKISISQTIFIAKLISIGFVVANYFVFLKKYKDKLIAGYDIYMSAVIQAAIMYQKLSGQGAGYSVPMHSWLNITSRNDKYLQELDKEITRDCFITMPA